MLGHMVVAKGGIASGQKPNHQQSSLTDYLLEPTLKSAKFVRNINHSVWMLGEQIWTGNGKSIPAEFHRPYCYGNHNLRLEDEKSAEGPAQEGPRRRGALASALGLWENNTSRKRGTSTDISEYISYYTAHSRENVIPTTQHAENIKPSSLQTGDVSAARGHHVSEHQEILSPSHCNQMGPTLGVQRPYHLPLPDASFVHFEPTPFSSPSNRNDFHCSSPSSVYPSEGIRSEECLSPPEMASVNRRSREFILSDLAQYCYRSSEGGERMSDHRSTSLTDGDGPPFRNVDTNLQEELAAAGEYGTRDTNTSTDDRSSEDTAADTSTDTMIGSACELMLTKQRAREEWKCVTADRVILEGNFANEVRETSASAVVCNDDGPAKDKIRASHGRFKFGKWMKKTWGRTGGRFFMKETGEKGHL